MKLRILVYVVVYAVLYSGLIPHEVSDLLEAACFSGLILHLIHSASEHLSSRKEKCDMCRLSATAVVVGDTVELTRACAEHNPAGDTNYIPLSVIPDMLSEGAFLVAIGELSREAFNTVVDALQLAGVDTGGFELLD